jgi:HK97 gp10 family phage protein
MMPTLRAVMTGGFDKQIAKALGMVQSNKRSVVMPAAKMMKTRWQDLAPYDHAHHKAGEEHYRDSIAIAIESESAYGVVITVSSPKWYGDLLEFGTSKMGAEPSVRPALDETEQAAPSMIGEELIAVLKR